MRKRRAEAAAAYEACWDGGKGSHHPDFDPAALAEAEAGGGVPGGGPPPARRASRPTEELYNAIVSDDVAAVYAALEAGADAGWEFGSAYRTAEGYTPLMVAAHRCVCFLCVCVWVVVVVVVVGGGSELGWGGVEWGCSSLLAAVGARGG